MGTPLKNVQHEAFALEYTIDFNGTQAAIRAGYAEGSAHVTASRLLRNAKVAARIQERMAELTMTSNEALYRLSQQGRGRVVDYLGLSIEELKTHPQAHLLHKVKHTRRYIPSFDEEKPDEVEDKIEYEIYNAQSAIALILKEQHLKAGEATEIVDDASLTDETRASRIAALLDAARARRDGPADSESSE